MNNPDFISLMKKRNEDINERAIKIHQLAQTPQFGSLIELIRDFGMAYFAEPPQKEEDRAKWETFGYADFFARKILTTINQDIELGARLSGETDKESSDAEMDDGRNKRRRA